MLPFLTTTPIFLFLFYLAKTEHKQSLILLLFSFVIYCFFPWQYGITFLVFVFFNTLIITTGLVQKRTYLTLGIAFNILLLVFFKFSPQLFPSIINGEFKNWLFPIGISFYALQGISSLVDSHRRPTPPRAKEVLLFLCFFPHLLMGPILKLNTFLKSITLKTYCDKNIQRGFSCIILGLFFKKVLADNLALQTQWLAYPQHLSFHSLNLALQLFSEHARLYADFYAYSIMAYGLAKAFGYTIILNFQSPFKAKNMTEFWRRWNISLSTFIRDYVYIPLGGQQVPLVQRYGNLLICFCLVGIWHGATRNFFYWGAFHGLILVLEKHLSPLFKIIYIKLPNLLKRLTSLCYTSIVLSLSMMFFRLETNLHFKSFFGAMVNNTQMTIDKQQVFLVFMFVCPIIIYDFMSKKFKLKCLINPYIVAFTIFLILTSFAPEQTFIYMRF